MNKRIILVFKIFFVLALCCASPVHADIPNHFVSTDGDSNIIQIQSLEKGWYFGVFDYGGNYNNGLDLLVGNREISSSEFEITQSGSDYILTVTSGPLNNGSFINLGSSPDFQFYFRNDTAPDFAFHIFHINGTNYSFESVQGGTVVGADLAPVPIPGSYVLMLSGIAGLLVLGSRKSEHT